MRLYNTLTRRKEEFVPLEENHVRMYHCGPTVYDHAHIGNFRAFVFADILRRYFEFRGYRVTQVMNITDVGHMTTDADEGEDKLEVAAKRQRKDPYSIARFYEASFFEDVDALRIRRAHHYPRATEHIPEMIALIEKLLKKGYAYKAADGVYFDVTKFEGYGKLSGNTVERLMAGARVAVNPNKRNPYDFALWKFDPKHLMQWDAPWGRGFPGWHIECSAMSVKYLGETFDIHTGGEDGIFPHHECEIAQSEAATGKPFVRFWLHVRFLLVDGQKMSKSLGNFYTVKDILKKGYSGRVLRYVLMSTHYRKNLNFTFEGLDAAKAAIERMENFVLSMQDVAGASDDPAVDEALKKAEKDFVEAMDDDIEISAALAAVFEMIRAVNRASPSQKQAQRAIRLMHRFDEVLAVLDVERKKEVPEEVLELVRRRQEARKAKDYATADAIREQVRKLGYLIEDTPKGPRVKPLSD
ncbi:MAG: cysteine--tRNA ligase [Planctomycetota bacterium]|nr:MAG: cysteine--tRNA ligase [Planctomycetota bacterium]